MTKTQLRRKTKEMKRGVMKLIDNKIEKAINSGCLPLSDYDDTYELPKALMSAIGSEIEFQYKPLTKTGVQIRNNIKHCI